MNWFLIALIAPALWSVSNHIDKFLINRYFIGVSTGALILFSSLAGLIVFPIILVIHPNVTNISLYNVLIIATASAIGIFQLFTYFYALKLDETSIVVSLFQTIPIFSYVLGYFVLGETLTIQQILAGLLIILGAMTISLDISDKIPKLKMKVFSIMLFSSFLVAVDGLLFKFIAIQSDFLTTSFWSYTVLSIIGLGILAFVKSYRMQFLSVFKKNKLSVVGINVLNEGLNIVAVLSMKSASLLAPLALVWIVNGFQPLFVFSFGVILTIFFPKFGNESLLRRHIIQKLMAIVIMFIGTILLNR